MGRSESGTRSRCPQYGQGILSPGFLSPNETDDLHCGQKKQEGSLSSWITSPGIRSSSRPTEFAGIGTTALQLGHRVFLPASASLARKTLAHDWEDGRIIRGLLMKKSKGVP